MAQSRPNFPPAPKVAPPARNGLGASAPQDAIAQIPRAAQTLSNPAIRVPPTPGAQPDQTPGRSDNSAATRRAIPGHKGSLVSKEHRPIRIGEVLVEQGVLTEQQVLEILHVQKRQGVPFGVLAEMMFEVTPQSIEDAWVEQYHRFAGTIDLEGESIDAQVLQMINRRQAWQFEILPLRFEPTGELLVAASRTRLARAAAFVAHRLTPIVLFRITESEMLRRFLMKHYPMPEVSEELMRKAREMANDISPAPMH